MVTIIPSNIITSDSPRSHLRQTSASENRRQENLARIAALQEKNVKNIKYRKKEISTKQIHTPSQRANTSWISDLSSLSSDNDQEDVSASFNDEIMEWITSYKATQRETCSSSLRKPKQSDKDPEFSPSYKNKCEKQERLKAVNNPKLLTGLIIDTEFSKTHLPQASEKKVSFILDSTAGSQSLPSKSIFVSITNQNIAEVFSSKISFHNLSPQGKK